MVLLALALCSPGRALDLHLGAGADLLFDPAGAIEPNSGSRAGLGGGLRVPVRVQLGQGAWLRGSLGAGLSRGRDRVEWEEYGGAVRYYSDQHWTLVQGTSLSLGPGVDIGTWQGPRPYLGAAVGAALVHHFHSFSGDSAVLLDPEQGDLSKGSHIDPYSRQVAPLAELSAGLRLAEGGPFAIEVEAGYTVAFLAEASLIKARPELEAVRTSHGLDGLRAGVAVAFPL